MASRARTRSCLDGSARSCLSCFHSRSRRGGLVGDHARTVGFSRGPPARLFVWVSHSLMAATTEMPRLEGFSPLASQS
jgi:hypothetical protein